MADKPAREVDTMGANRKTWDKTTFEKKARDRVERELEDEREALKAKAPPRVVVQRAPLDKDKARADQNLNMLAEVGKKTTFTSKTPAFGRSPFYCTVCSCELRDSANWLAHLNGKNHVRNLGMNLRAERSTLQGVKAKLAAVSEKKQEDLTPDEAAAAFRTEFDERVRLQEEDVRRERQAKREAERAHKHAERAAAPLDGPEDEPVEADPMMAMMGFGFGGFGSTKQKR
ncbi:hypothetical protein T492DRAFT_930192 [Pavlovales sp. CCMP2436]|nr:hypothetical protein T492DRAFT_930192 [Pavlovales sp. CCMP2436]